MNVKNVVRQCEMLVMLSNGKSNRELDFVYNTAKNMVENGMGNMSFLIFNEMPDNIKISDVCSFMRNLRIWRFYVIGDYEMQFKWQSVAKLCKIEMINEQYALRYHP